MSKSLPVFRNLSSDRSLLHGVLRQVRPLSTNSAINRSLRKSQSVPSKLSTPTDGGYESQRARRPAVGRRSRSRPQGEHDTYEHLRISYTTPASVFLYGTSVVKAALEARRRKFYKLYVYEGINREAQEQEKQVRRLAQEHRVVTRGVKGDDLRLMDKLSHGRPHNGFILEASPLPQLPVTGLQRVGQPSRGFAVMLDHQTREQEAINGTSSMIRSTTSHPRYPLVVFLDGILDSGNLGAIIRSAFFLGVDAVCISHHSAAVSAVALKASAGAFELLPTMTVAHPIAFLKACKANDWKIYAADAPDNSGNSHAKTLTTSTLGQPLLDRPCMVILGGEGEGLRGQIRKTADFVLGIQGDRARQIGIDSLNVSVAGALLFEAFLKTSNFSRIRPMSERVDSEGKDQLF